MRQVVGERDGEILAQCRADGVDLASAMVTAGRAFAFVPYSAQYIAQETAAVSANRGVHAHHCALPWEWRAQLDGQRRLNTASIQPGNVAGYLRAPS